MTDYYYTPGMLHPFWSVSLRNLDPRNGETETVAHNQDAETDMGDLYDEEFFTMFPTAVKISKQQYDDRTSP